MRLNDWSVVIYNTSQKPVRVLVYGGIDEFVEENGINTSGMKIIPQEEWTINDMVEICGNLLEDINHHKTEAQPRFIVDCMQKAGVDENSIKCFMRIYMEDLFNHYGY